jgi:hypothetical protein
MYFSSYNFMLIEQANNRTMAYNYNHSKLICIFGLGFAEALAHSLRRRKCKCAITMTTLNLILTRAYSAHFFSIAFKRLKKGKDVWFFGCEVFMVAF